MTSHENYVIKSVEKAVLLLQVLAKAESPGIGVSELARRLSFNKNQTFRLLKTLEHQGLVEQEERTGAYHLGIGLFSLASHAQSGMGLVQAAAPTMDMLAETTGESVHLVALHRLEAVMVDVRESSQNVRLTATLGGRYPLHAGACPQAILANLPESLVAQVFDSLPTMPRYTSATVIDPKELMERMIEVREQGYAISDEDVDPGARAVGAAILNRDAFPVGAVSVAGPSSRLSLQTLSRYGQQVMGAAAEIATRMELVTTGNHQSLQRTRTIPSN